MCADPVGNRILVEKPTIRSDNIDMEYLRSLPKNTFGFAYTQFMDSHRCRDTHSMSPWRIVVSNEHGAVAVSKRTAARSSSSWTTRS